MTYGQVPGGKVPQARVDSAIDRGAAWLVDLSKGGKIPVLNTAHAGELTYQELVLYTMLYAGVPETDPEYQKLLQDMLTRELKRTYCVALQAMALHHIDPELYQGRIAQCAQFLVDNQCDNGQWSYGNPVKLDVLTPTPSPKRKDVESGTARPGSAGGGPDASGQVVAPAKKEKRASSKALKPVLIKQRGKGPPSGDNSNTQYAALGLRACFESGIVIEPKVLQLAHDWWEQAQNTMGGWHYGGASGEPYGSMSAGGLGSLCIYRYYLKKPGKGEKRIEDGAAWLGREFVVGKNPKAPAGHEQWIYYYLYGIERAGALYGTNFFGGHDWYNEGAEWILAQQAPDGHWNGNCADTCWAILFLRRATQPLKKVFSGR